MTAPPAREQAGPPSPPERRPPRRGGGSSPSGYAASAAGRAAGSARLAGGRRGRLHSTRALAAAAWVLALGALALPATTEAQTATTLVSNTGQGSDTNLRFDGFAQNFTTGSNAGGYTLTGVDVVSASSMGFWVDVCAGAGRSHPTNCTTLLPPTSFAVGTMAFTAPANTTLVGATTYAVVVQSYTFSYQGYGATTSDGEDMGFAAGWSIDDRGVYGLVHAERVSEGISLDRGSVLTTKLRIAIKGTVAGGGEVTNNARYSPTGRARRARWRRTARQAPTSARR